MAQLTQEELLQHLRYEPDTGHFFWVKPGRGRRRNEPAGCVQGGPGKGYILIRLNGRLHKAHRLAWLAVHGVFPPDEIDHDNGNKADNKFLNLKAATHAQNGQNLKREVLGAAGLQGVHFDESVGKYSASVTVEHRKKHLGYFDTAEIAHGEYLQAKAREHPFANLARLTA